MTFRYSVGLNNVGSYQVSGRPWCKHFTPTGQTNGLIEFPNVVDSLFAHFDDNSGGHTIKFAFCEPKRALNFIGATPTYYQSDISSLGLTEASVSIWLNIETISVTRLFEIIHVGGGSTRMQIHDIATPTIRFYIDNSFTSTILGTFPFSNNEWINVTATIKDGESKLFINGQQIGLTNLTSFSNTLGTLNLGDDNNPNFDGVYDNVAIFSRALTEDEVSEIYNDGLFKDPRSTNVSSDIVGLWDFEDNQYKNFYSTPDTTSTINDRISNNNLTIVGNTADVEFVDGQLLSNALDRHSIEISGHEQTTITAKIKQIFYSTSNSSEFSICASLTNIPSEKMYDLTGPGIDE